MAAILRANASAAPGTTLSPTASTMPPLGPLDPPWPGANGTNLTLAAVDDEFSEDLGYSDMQIVFLACVLTAGPLLAVLLSIVGVRFVWRKFQGVDLDDELDEILRQRAETRQSLSQEQLKTSESQFTVLASDDAEFGRGGGGAYANHADGVSVSVVSGTGAAAGAGADLTDGRTAAGGGAAPGVSAPPPHRQMQHNTVSSCSSNGSVITLTMHNNHLIVEKEEIVESSYEDALYALGVPDAAYAGQQALVHPPPPAPELVKGADTGLSQPDLSGGSEGENPAYAYGNQVGYDAGPMGYTSYNGYRVEEPPSRLRQAPRPQGPQGQQQAPRPRPLLPGPQDSMDVQDVQDLPEDSPQPQRLLSDIQARKDALLRQEDHVQDGLELAPPPAENGSLDLSAGLDLPAADEGDDDSTSADVCSVKAQSPTPAAVSPSPPQTLSLSLGRGGVEHTLRSPTVEKLRLQDAASPDVERPAPATSRTSTATTSTPPRSPLAQRPDGGGRDQNQQ